MNAGTDTLTRFGDIVPLARDFEGNYNIVAVPAATGRGRIVLDVDFNKYIAGTYSEAGVGE